MLHSKYEPPGCDYWLEINDYTKDKQAHNKNIYFYIWCKDYYIGSAFTMDGDVLISLGNNSKLS